MLKKEFKYKAPTVDDPAKNTPDENGITDAMLEFDSELHLEPSVSMHSAFWRTNSLSHFVCE